MKIKITLILFFGLMMSTMSYSQDDEIEVIEEEVEDTIEMDPVFMKVESMPIFKGCEDVDKEIQKKCSDTKTIEYVSKHVRYPAIAQENGHQGTVYIEYIVGKEGKVENAKVVRGVHDALDAEALRVVKKLTYHSPGMQRGKAVKVKMILPVRFVLTK